MLKLKEIDVSISNKQLGSSEDLKMCLSSNHQETKMVAPHSGQGHLADGGRGKGQTHIFRLQGL
jgi:hypothetical protein